MVLVFWFRVQSTVSKRKVAAGPGAEGVHGGIAKLPVDSQLQAIYSADIVPDRAKVFRRTWWSRR